MRFEMTFICLVNVPVFFVKMQNISLYVKRELEMCNDFLNLKYVNFL